MRRTMRMVRSTICGRATIETWHILGLSAVGLLCCGAVLYIIIYEFMVVRVRQQCAGIFVVAIGMLNLHVPPLTAASYDPPPMSSIVTASSTEVTALASHQPTSSGSYSYDVCVSHF